MNMKSLIKSWLPSPMRRQLTRMKTRFLGPPDPEIELEQELLTHARQTGFDRLLKVVRLIEDRHGHRRSVQEKKPVDAAGTPVPWYTYPAISYLQQLDLAEKNVFEFGAGNSSLFYAQRAKRVVSVEKDRDWQATLAATAPANLQVLLQEEKEDYLQAIARTGQLWDLVVIDGHWRRECAEVVVPCLSPGGLVILDNSDWYPNTAGFLRQADLIQVDFTGLGPINYYTWTTSFFFHRQVNLRPRGLYQPETGLGSLPNLSD